MYEQINAVDPRFNERCEAEPGEVIYWLLGKQIAEVEYDVMTEIWKISGTCIADMYLKTLRQREGVG